MRAWMRKKSKLLLPYLEGAIFKLIEDDVGKMKLFSFRVIPGISFATASKDIHTLPLD